MLDPAALGDIGYTQKYQSDFLPLSVIDPSGVQGHDLWSDRGELVLHLEILDNRIRRKDFLQQLPQLWTIPLVIAQLIDKTIFRFLGRNLKSLVEGLVSRHDFQLRIEDEQGFSRRMEDVLGILFGMLQAGDVGEREDDAVNHVIRGAIRKAAQHVPEAIG